MSMDNQSHAPSQEKSEFDDKIVKNYRIIKPIGMIFIFKQFLKVIYRSRQIFDRLQGPEDDR